jgi:dual specificity MAP kinase phosphatase
MSRFPPVYTIDIESLAATLDHWASQPLPDPSQVFPWLHGLHPRNRLQLGFFTNRKRSLRQAPKCWRGITIVKVGGDLAVSRLKGAVAPTEVLAPSGLEFLFPDPPEGFSVRNFQIQTAKLAALSDIIVYGDDEANQNDVLDIAARIATAQHDWKMKNDPKRLVPEFNTFILTSAFREVEERYPSLVTIDSRGEITGQVMDFFLWERLEMCSMTEASEISTNVWQGPTPEYLLKLKARETACDERFDLLIEANDLASIPPPHVLDHLERKLKNGPQRLEFPSSGSLMPPSSGPGEQRELDNFVNTIRWMHYLANSDGSAGESDSEGDIPMVTSSRKPYKILIHGPDGYTESSLLALAYVIYAEGIPAKDAWLKLHTDKKRNFFAYPIDVSYLTSIQERLLKESPATKTADLSSLSKPSWFDNCDGSFPSRILPYMYLGSLTHANNPDMLWKLGIRRVLSIGESLAWSEGDYTRFGSENLMSITDVRDNGIDPLTKEFDRCLEFIRRGKRDGAATLVHCRVGVSRSATICIAEVMASLNISFPRAYCYVRARRLNVIVQPHLRFVYELLKWEELQLQKRGEPVKRELEWQIVAREIALMNMPYTR